MLISLSLHSMMAIDATGTMIVIGNEIGNLEGYRFINQMTFPVKITQAVSDVAFLAVGAFCGKKAEDIFDVIVLDKDVDQDGLLDIASASGQTIKFLLN